MPPSLSNKSEYLRVIESIQEIQKHRIKLFKGVISAFYIFGIIGLSIPTVSPYFQMATPFTLILSLGILLLFHQGWNSAFGIFAVSAMVLGFASEVMGIHTGFPFGNYTYGKTLGLQLFEVPLVIGVNWLLLVYLTGNLFSSRIQNDWLAAVLATALMVAIDVIIEPVAINLDFWTWEGDVIPLSNYIGWFGVSFVIQIGYRKSVFFKENAISRYLLFNLVTFFTILYFIV
ncbi:carotenoid biosynthesis protein [Aquiflexum sp. TKW24L]|uniref:carotenoid biosynthesis protein n=1 Tax=Aquiflexum sp. TKW24L TaxID=2942212 RepID=UPI0020C0D565|nr:carotenoid biosynthesis protein [Aquiflexum sp. TKW24L]MCL6261122.1 carotenoid biosynthesis protein [Aquiflexum sp. TKW24L]